LACSQYEYRARNNNEDRDESGLEMSSRQSACARAWVGGVDGGIGPPIECHRGGSRSHHRNNDPGELVRRRNSSGGEHRAAEREREREDRVLPLDHFKRQPEIVQDSHASIVKQDSRESAVKQRLRPGARTGTAREV